MTSDATKDPFNDELNERRHHFHTAKSLSRETGADAGACPVVPWESIQTLNIGLRILGTFATDNYEPGWTSR